MADIEGQARESRGASESLLHESMSQLQRGSEKECPGAAPSLLAACLALRRPRLAPSAARGSTEHCVIHLCYSDQRAIYLPLKEKNEK